MARTYKLNDLQLILLSAAAQRESGSLLPPAESMATQGARVRSAVTGLIKRGLANEVDAACAEDRWRTEGDRSIGVSVTAAGRAAIGVEKPVCRNDDAQGEGATDRGQQSSQESDTPAAGMLTAAQAKPGNKIGQVLALLRREQGATLAELVEATGWLPHTTRAALTGLRKKGYAIAKVSRDDATCYSAAA